MRTGHIARVLLSVVLVFLCFGPQPSQGATEQDLIRVWVGYQPGKGHTVRQLLEQERAEFHYDFQRLEAYVVTLPQAALSGLGRHPDVAAIEEDLPVALVEPVEGYYQDFYFDPSLYTRDVNGQMVPWGIDAVQARDVWDQNRNGEVDPSSPTGEGVKVCLIDSGILASHEEFQEIDLLGGVSLIDDDWAADSFGHGTFITGVLAAANNAVGVVGVTPGPISLYVVKAVAGDGYMTYMSALVDGLYHCLDAGANIINMSNGSDTPQGFERKALEDLYGQGVLLVASAGNDGTDEKRYPASFDSTISVGAIGLDHQVASFSNQNDQIELVAPGDGIVSTFHEIHINTLTVDEATYYAMHMDYAARGGAQGVLVDGGRCLEGGDWAGAVVLCERGDALYSEKVRFVEESGGVAAVVYNNEPGIHYGALSFDGSITSDIIAITISQADGQYLVANKLGSVGYVYSYFLPEASGYDLWAGTSFSCAHVSAVAALLWSYDPSLTNVEIRQAMQQSALDLGTPGRDPAYGFGLVQAAAALEYLKNPPSPDCSADGVCNPACQPGLDPDCPWPGYCGDGVCLGNETCQNCRDDCVITHPTKGDLTCCGNGVCEKRESATQCPADCQ